MRRSTVLSLSLQLVFLGYNSNALHKQVTELANEDNEIGHMFKESAEDKVFYNLRAIYMSNKKVRFHIPTLFQILVLTRSLSIR